MTATRARTATQTNGVTANLEAEAALIGELIHVPDRYSEVAEMVTGTDFARPAFGHIFDAIGKLIDQGLGVDGSLIAEQLHDDQLLDAVGGRAVIVEAQTASTGNWRAHARSVADHARRRRVAHAAHDLAEAANLGQNLEPILVRLDRLRLPAVTVDPIDPDLDTFLEAEESDDFDWLVPDLLERGDRVILTAAEGIGKSTLLRQIGVQLASGLTPFTLAPIDPLQVLYIDTENSARQARRALRRLRHAAGDLYQPGRLRLRVLGEAIDLARPAVLADLAARIRAQHVDVIIAGPLYKMISDDPLKEEPARAVADALDRLRSIRGSALIIEAHSPYAEGSRSKRPIRPYGASLWSRWPEFGIHLGEEGRITHWRAQRDQRSWPTLLAHSTPWPWAPVDGADEPTDWEGPTECAAALVALLTDSGDELTRNQLCAAARGRGLHYRDKVIAAAAELATADGRLAVRLGPRNSRLYRSTGTTPADGQEPLDDF